MLDRNTNAFTHDFGDTPAVFTVNSPTSITAKVPSIADPDGRWRVTTPSGTATSANTFIVG